MPSGSVCVECGRAGRGFGGSFSLSSRLEGTLGVLFRSTESPRKKTRGNNLIDERSLMCHDSFSSAAAHRKRVEPRKRHAIGAAVEQQHRGPNVHVILVHAVSGDGAAVVGKDLNHRAVDEHA